MNMRRGFTLIELLVVIAIIGILAAIILASLSGARGKANDSKIQEQLKGMVNAAELYYSSNNNSYGSDSAAGDNICSVDNTDTTGLYNLEQTTSWPDATTATCSTDAGSATPATQYDVYHALSSGSYWCADSTGVSKFEPSGWTPPSNGDPCP